MRVKGIVFILEHKNLYDIEIVDDEGNECDAGIEGEIIIRTDKSKPLGMFNGYYRDEELPKTISGKIRRVQIREEDIE